MTTHPIAVDTTAPVVVRAVTTVQAPLSTVWDLHTDIAAWAGWNPDVDRVEYAGPLAPGTAFRWLTHGLDITSTLHQVVPRERIVWGGPAHGIDGIHVWTFQEAAPGTVTVCTEESWSGAPVEARPAELEQLLRQSLDAWLRALKDRAEALAGAPAERH
ncbi:SRPBCC family protein [Streptomyces sp. NRRL F-2664]|uniref:SRPBCC family protein n=1 Tax=Streptomyces sp. NRRL F-2664 TaxID=1463842 RepID=UPI0005B8E0D7|nr:SRPBCC family protein [Streptomyces sp. NRRL F-2664]